MEIEHMDECTIKELRAAIDWRKQERTRLYRGWDSLDAADLGKFEQYQEEIMKIVAHIDERKAR